ncbi:MAG: glycosyltransferase family 1 protein [Acidobacteria bacterium]|nr:glycosyltransferase family 1 protein [Acidobacteriota bacterium]
MRVAIDARKLHDFGIGTYTRNLLRHLARIDQDNEYILLCHEPDVGIGAHLGPNFRTTLVRAENYSVREQFQVPWVLHRERPDVFHAPHYVLPPAVRCKSIVTIHDCIHLMFPQYLPNRAAYLYAKASMWSAARRSHKILTVSEASKRDIIRLLNVPADKIVVVYNAIDERFGVAPSDDAVERIRERYQLDRPFVLYVGNIKPHKNLVRLVEAFDQLRARGFVDLTLLIIGDEISKLPALRRAVHSHKLHKHVRFLGYLPDETLAILYRLSAAFAFPSLYEGFGLPPLEAMACGAPVVTSNVSSLPEVTGDAAVLVDPYDPASIADGLATVLRDPALGTQMRTRGFARAREFSWERSVARTWEIYKEVAGHVEPTSA